MTIDKDKSPPFDFEAFYKAHNKILKKRKMTQTFRDCKCLSARQCRGPIFGSKCKIPFFQDG